MLADAKAIYLATRKQHDQLFNTYVMRPLAAVVVAAVSPTRVTPNQLTLLSVVVFAGAAAMLVLLPSSRGAIAAIATLELSYLFDCADGMLARHRGRASRVGHLFDFFTDELKAVLLVAALAVRLWRTGGYGIDAALWPPASARFLLAGIASVAVVAAALSLTNFVRRPELSGRDTPVAAHYEALDGAPADPNPDFFATLRRQPLVFLQFLNHYPSHIYAFAALGRLDAFFWIYLVNNALYLGKGWLSLFLRFGRFEEE